MTWPSARPSRPPLLMWSPQNVQWRWCPPPEDRRCRCSVDCYLCSSISRVHRSRRLSCRRPTSRWTTASQTALLAYSRPTTASLSPVYRRALGRCPSRQRVSSTTVASSRRSSFTGPLPARTRSHSASSAPMPAVSSNRIVAGGRRRRPRRRYRLRRCSRWRRWRKSAAATARHPLHYSVSCPTSAPAASRLPRRNRKRKRRRQWRQHRDEPAVAIARLQSVQGRRRGASRVRCRTVAEVSLVATSWRGTDACTAASGRSRARSVAARSAGAITCRHTCALTPVRNRTAVKSVRAASRAATSAIDIDESTAKRRLSRDDHQHRGTVNRRVPDSSRDNGRSWDFSSGGWSPKRG